MLWRYRSFRVRNPGIVTNQRTFGTRCANTRSTWDKWGFCQELQPHGRGIHRRNGYSAGNHQIMKEESNYQLIDEEST
jgi:hypothetical protein